MTGEGEDGYVANLDELIKDGFASKSGVEPDAHRYRKLSITCLSRLNTQALSIHLEYHRADEGM